MHGWTFWAACGVVVSTMAHAAEWTLEPPPDCTATTLCVIAIGPCELIETPAGLRPSVAGDVRSMTPGEPDIPLLVKLLPIPPDCEAAVVLVSAEFAETNGVEIAPVAGYRLADPLSDESRWTREQIPDERLYSMGTLWPDEVLRVETALQGHQRWARVVCRPVQFNPVHGTLRMYSRIEARLVWRRSTDTE